MKLLEDYVLLTEIIANSKMSKSYKAKQYSNKILLGKLSFVFKKDLLNDDKDNLSKFTNLSNLYPMGELSLLLGRDRDHLSHMMNPTKTSGIKAKPIKVIKVGNKYNMIVLTDEFILNIRKGLTPFLINTNIERNYKEEYEDYIIIDFYDMKVGFY
ncbi:hypothetical protein [Aliarcobacter butzleri]|uniref:hypothetical protein n=1 Tax=Aliarcobacter butzleri TaxID=28197 RepID=UPI00126A042F|nr:hypothetical protein [Aliarcobacter butzleri]